MQAILRLLSRLKGFIPLAVLTLGYLLSEALEAFTALIPYSILIMLFMTFLKVHPQHIKLRASHFTLLAIQLGLGLLVYLVSYHWWADAATSMLLCFLTPCATAGPPIVQLLKGDTPYITTYVLLTHAAFVVLTPFVFPYVGGIDTGESIALQMWHIFYQVAKLVLPSIVLAWLLVWWKPRLAERIGSYTQVSYWVWLLSLILLVAHTTEYLGRESRVELSDLYVIAGLGLATCLLQYLLGHRLSALLGIEQHASRHSLGQKNTSLAIWIAAIFLPPLDGIGITSYIIWQNIIISSVMSYYRGQQQSTEKK